MPGQLKIETRGPFTFNDKTFLDNFYCEIHLNPPFIVKSISHKPDGSVEYALENWPDYPDMTLAWGQDHYDWVMGN